MTNNRCIVRKKREKNKKNKKNTHTGAVWQTPWNRETVGSDSDRLCLLRCRKELHSDHHRLHRTSAGGHVPPGHQSHRGRTAGTTQWVHARARKHTHTCCLFIWFDLICCCCGWNALQKNWEFVFKKNTEVSLRWYWCGKRQTHETRASKQESFSSENFLSKLFCKKKLKFFFFWGGGLTVVFHSRLTLHQFFYPDYLLNSVKMFSAIELTTFFRPTAITCCGLLGFQQV